MFTTGQTHSDFGEHTVPWVNAQCLSVKPTLPLTNAPMFPCHDVINRPNHGKQRSHLPDLVWTGAYSRTKKALTLMLIPSLDVLVFCWKQKISKENFN
jgi:hypothetical protein